MNNVIIVLLMTIIIIFVYICFVIKDRLTLNKIRYNLFIYLFTLLYLLFLFLVLFNREKTHQSFFSDGTYIKKWMSLLFKNKTVFINVIGNIMIFIPMGILFKIYGQKIVVSVVTMIVIIILIESMQYFTKRGVFDILDILLNLIGTTIGYMIIRIKR